MAKIQNAAADKIDPATDDPALDADRDGMIDIDPSKAQETLAEIVQLDHELRDHGSSVAALLRAYARTSAGLRL